MTILSPLQEMFTEEFKCQPAATAFAPGRLEILGNHTDYNEGLVLSAAVEQKTFFAVSPVPGKKCQVKDFRDGSRVEFSLDEIDQPVPGDWSNYIKGVVCEFRQRGSEIGAFQAGLLSTVPLSAGMSSSAALEVSAILSLSKINNIDISKEECALIGQGVENKYLGVQSGLLDQFSSLFGRKNSLIFCDFRKVTVEKNIDVPEGYVIVVANSMVKHDLVDSDYNQRRESCEKVVELINKNHSNVKALRDVSSDLLEGCRDSLNRIDYLRAKHVVQENERVLAGTKALETGDIEFFGKLLYESHQSSIDNFENSCPELDCLVELSTSLPGCLGARLSGGGFGGITIHLVKDSEAETYCQRLKTAYEMQTGNKIETIISALGDGADLISN